ncbi:MAG: hypothetical protein Q8T13_04220 [Acidobacteriota bacterium]|nr:hypothetical protein [Acidobacteriota bacterium]
MRMFDTLGALAVSLLPRRHWRAFDQLPLHVMAPVAGVLTSVAGAALGIRGFFDYLERMRGSAAGSIIAVAQQQITGGLPETAAVSAVPSTVWMVAPVAFAFFTPLGLFSIYLVGSGLARAVSGWIDEPFGDPILTAIDSLIRRLRGTAVTRTAERERLAAEGADEPDRRYPAAWADLPGADFVIVAARRKAGWTPGTFVITDEGWFTLGQSFDRPTPNGLRTIYPLTVLQTLEVLRKGVPYDMPPLRPYPPRRRGPVAEPLPPPNES